MNTVAVLITCFNKEPFLDECVSSLIRQTHYPEEIIVVHDKCDKPMHHAQATSIFLPKNVGVSKAREVAFHNSTADYIVFLDGDDMLSPDYLDKMLTAMKKVDVAYPDIYFFSEKGTRLFISKNRYFKKDLIRDRRIPIPVSSMMKRETYVSSGGFKNMPILEDLQFWARLMCNDYTFGKAQTLFMYRQVPGTRRHADNELRKQVLAQIMEEVNSYGEEHN